MYGTATGGAAGTLAATGLATGSYFLAITGVVLAGVGLLLLVRPGKKVRP